MARAELIFTFLTVPPVLALVFMGFF